MDRAAEVILTRRSCKKYKPDKVDKGLIRQVIDAGLCAATGMNMQSPVIVAVTNDELRAKLTALNSKYDKRHREDPYYGAPVILVVLADNTVPTAVYDGSLAMGNMMLQAHALGLGSCWIHRAKEVFDDPEGREIFKALGIGDNYVGIGNLALGYAEEENKNPHTIKENRVFWAE
ncbi:MAG: nitroreductase [Firmicutes bacterium]|nr:nitroreductase [Bacillota bacterium]